MGLGLAPIHPTSFIDDEHSISKDPGDHDIFAVRHCISPKDAVQLFSSRNASHLSTLASIKEIELSNRIRT
jgi:hypothetical protein